MSLVLYIGNRRYSSWSLRGWLAARLTGEPVETRMIWLDRPDTQEKILAVSGAGRVPVLQHRGRSVWDSLAIGLYLHRAFPAAGLLPDDEEAAALLLSAVAEMHAGFPLLRQHLPMDLLSRHPEGQRPPGVDAEIARVQEVWAECRGRFGGGGPFLFGRPTLADCFYAPVATRFATYGVTLAPVAAGYRDAVLAWPLLREWTEPAADEPLLDLT